MNVIPRVKIDLVQYRGPEVLINVIPQLVNPDTNAVVAANPFENVFTTQEKLQAAAEARGAKTWDDADIIAAVKGARFPDTEKVETVDGEEKRTTVQGALRFPDASIIL